MGAFGLLDCPQPRFPAHRLIETQARIDAWQLVKDGLLAPGVTEIWLESGPVGCCRPIHGPNVLKVVTVPDVAGRRWFSCPACNRRCRFLYIPAFECAKCARLEHSVRHRYRTIPGLWRVLQLRKRWGLSPQPFSRLPRRQRRHVRYARACEEILELEAKLVGYLAEINRVLERRIKLRKAAGKC